MAEPHHYSRIPTTARKCNIFQLLSNFDADALTKSSQRSCETAGGFPGVDGLATGQFCVDGDLTGHLDCA